MNKWQRPGSKDCEKDIIRKRDLIGVQFALDII